MALTPADVARLAGLARIDLSDAELAHLAPQLDVILESVARVTEVAGADVAVDGGDPIDVRGGHLFRRHLPTCEHASEIGG